MTPSQTTLDSKPEYCEYSEALENYFRCKLTDFGFVWRCIEAERANCPDLEFFRKQKQEGKKK